MNPPKPSTTSSHQPIPPATSRLSTQIVGVLNYHHTSHNDQRTQDHHEMLDTLIRHWMPLDILSPEALDADLMPVLSDTSTEDPPALLGKIKKELYRKMKNFLEEFFNQDYREYPYSRNLSWSVSEEPKLEYTLTLTINRPTPFSQFRQ
ncbi:unnamed protein product [Rotaria sordida]|uniref:Uncharacterized protein n=1 Tax=Rotaria sordida TaxID=392033 RepID=A0A814BG26_9BILA|nr:unnamed protein product [Rotaria sordida]CAF0968914.1 unnamed protein product [Rotaria sordida]CAF1039757.1 unnamed protein product [Rotaria sordida]CAF1040799.1 unnamed protein product [Rotaria sordida]CAF1194546.1 unnamed protein product [Rotaria sordida]